MATSPVYGDLPLFTVSELESSSEAEASEMDEFSEMDALLTPHRNAEPPFVCESCDAVAGYYAADYRTVCCPNCGGDARPTWRPIDSVH